MLTPLGVLGPMNIHAGGVPYLGELVGILDPEVRRAGPAVAVWHDAEMDLYSIAGGESVPAPFVGSVGKPSRS
jgi:hypothetical protein